MFGEQIITIQENQNIIKLGVIVIFLENYMK